MPQNPGSLHLYDDLQIVEVVDTDGRRLPDGEQGEIVITQLTCYAQPLIRYRIGDLGYRLAERCPCGRGLGLMGPSAGVGSCISPFGEVRRWEARQLSPDTLRILLVPTGEWEDGSLEAIRRSVQTRLGDALEVDLVLVSEMPLAPSGKVQTIIPLDALAPVTSASPESDWQSPSEDADFA